jgi:chemotaxis protein MotB
MLPRALHDRRRRSRPVHVGRDRWLVSYADFVTLLFALFVVLYALSSVNEGKYRTLSQSLTAAFGAQVGTLRAAEAMIELPKPKNADEAAKIARDAAAAKRREQRMYDLSEALRATLSPLDARGPLRISQSPKGIVVEIGAGALFKPADARLEPEAVKVLGAAARVLANVDNAVRIEGHTDSIPISTPIYPSNWELSAARASAVARLLADNAVQAGRIGVTGYAEYRPVDSNATAAGRARNRRVTLLVLSDSADEQHGIPARDAETITQ